jgi:hypothetical protein
MRAVHRRAVLVLAVSMVLTAGCEPIESLFGFGGEETADEPEAEVVAASDEEADLAEEAAEAGEPAGDEPAGDEPATEESAAEEAEAPDGTGGDGGVSTAACTGDDTMLEQTLPPEAEDVQTTNGDMAGDGQVDEVLTYRIGSIYYVRIVAASGYIVERELEDASDLAPVAPLGTLNLGGDRDVVLVLESAGASGQNVALFAIHDWDDEPCALGPVTIPDHTVPRTFAIGGTVGQSSGLGCTEVAGAPALTVSEATQSADGYDWMQTTWRWFDRGALEFVSDEMASIPQGDDLPGIGQLDCAGMALP